MYCKFGNSKSQKIFCEGYINTYNRIFLFQVRLITFCNNVLLLQNCWEKMTNVFNFLRSSMLLFPSIYLMVQSCNLSDRLHSNFTGVNFVMIYKFWIYPSFISYIWTKTSKLFKPPRSTMIWFGIKSYWNTSYILGTLWSNVLYNSSPYGTRQCILNIFSKIKIW